MEKINLTQKAKLAIGVALIISAVVIPFIFSQPSTPTTSKNQVEKIRLKKKGEELTISRHGQVTIKSGGKLIMQYWDKNRINEIFAQFDQLQETSFSVEGKTIIVDLDNLEQAEELASLAIFTDQESQIIVQLLANADVSSSPTPTQFFIQTTYHPAQPTSRPTGRYSQPIYSTPTPFLQPEATTTQKPFRCVFEEPEEGKDGFIISETVCTELID